MKKDKRKVNVTRNKISNDALKELALYLVKLYNKDNIGNNVLENIA